MEVCYFLILCGLSKYVALVFRVGFDKLPNLEWNGGQNLRWQTVRREIASLKELRNRDTV